MASEADSGEDGTQLSDPSFSPTLRMWEARETDSRRDTGSKLKRAGELSVLSPSANFSGIALLPSASVALSPSDAPIIARQGVCALNCSWQGELLNSTSRLQSIFRRAKVPRSLPWLVATNDTKYGQPSILSTAEALAATLSICGFDDAAHRLLSRFRWGPEFWKVNREYLNRYRQCSSSAEVVAAQEDALAQARAEQAERKQQSIENMMPPSQSSSDDDGDNGDDLCTPNEADPGG